MHCTSAFTVTVLKELNLRAQFLSDVNEARGRLNPHPHNRDSLERSRSFSLLDSSTPRGINILVSR